MPLYNVFFGLVRARRLESKMLSRVRRWCKKAYQADKAKPLSEQSKEDEKLAHKFGLPMTETHKTDSAR